MGRGHVLGIALFFLVAAGLLPHVGAALAQGAEPFAWVEAERFPAGGGIPATVRLLIHTGDGRGKRIEVAIPGSQRTNTIVFLTDSQGEIDTGKLEIPEGASEVIVKPLDAITVQGIGVWSEGCTIPLDEIPEGSSRRFCELFFDTTPPHTTISLSPRPNSYGWNNTDVEVTLEASDRESGVKELCYRLTGATERDWDCRASDRVSFTIGAEGVTTVHYYARDVAGNEEWEHTREVRIDKTRPRIDLQAASSIGPWGAQQASVSWEAADGLSGLEACEVTLIRERDGREWRLSTSCSGQEGLSAEDYGEGKFTVRIWARDRAGNEDTKSFRISLTGPQRCAIRGEVVDATTGDPLAGARVRLSPTGRTASTAADGSFSFTELEPRTYTITAEAEGYSQASREVSCRAGETAEVVLALLPIPGQPPPWPLTETIDLGYGDVVERDAGFESSEDVKVYKVNMPAGATLTVQVMDCCVPGDIWRAEIYESYPELKASTEGDGSIEVWSPPAQATILTGTAYVVIKYVKGVDLWPAGMSIRFEVSG